jgi:hypothetical protein
MTKAPSPDNDTTRKFPRTLQEAFPSTPEWQEKPPLHDKVLAYIAMFVAGYLLALVVMGY